MFRDYGILDLYNYKDLFKVAQCVLALTAVLCETIAKIGRDQRCVIDKVFRLIMCLSVKGSKFVIIFPDGTEFDVDFPAGVSLVAMQHSLTST